MDEIPWVAQEEKYWEMIRYDLQRKIKKKMRFALG